MVNYASFVPNLNKHDIEKRAAALGMVHEDSFRGKEPVPIDKLFEDYCEENGIRTAYTNLTHLGLNVFGYTNGTQRISLIHDSIANDFSEHGRRLFRSTVGHEYGHCALHVYLDQWRESILLDGQGLFREASNINITENPEWQAWYFCSAVLMQKHLVYPMVRKFGTGDSAIAAMMETFDVNYRFVRSRLRNLKLLPRDSGNCSRGKKQARNPRWPGNLAQPWQINSAQDL